MSSRIATTASAIESHQRNERLVIQAVIDGLLKIDHLGRIWRIGTVSRDRWGNPPTIKPCVPRRAEHFAGDYFHVRQTIDGVRVTCMAHRLVWHHFKGEIPIGAEINHRNGDKIHNHLRNLECVTRSGNMKHAFKTGLNKYHGSTIIFPKKTIEKCRELRRKKWTIQAIADATGVSSSHVFRIVKNQSRAS